MVTKQVTVPTTVESLKDLLARHGDYLDIRFSYLFAQLTGRPETEVLSNVRSLATLLEITSKPERGHTKYKVGLQSACESILDWYSRANEYPLDHPLDFIATHNQQCVWAVLVGKVQAGYKIKIERW